MACPAPLPCPPGMLLWTSANLVPTVPSHWEFGEGETSAGHFCSSAQWFHGSRDLPDAYRALGISVLTHCPAWLHGLAIAMLTCPALPFSHFCWALHPSSPHLGVSVSTHFPVTPDCSHPLTLSSSLKKMSHLRNCGEVYTNDVKFTILTLIKCRVQWH